MHKSITVETNDPVRPTLFLHISGLVDRLYTISKENIHLRGKAGTEITQVLTVVPEEESPFRILNAEMKDGRYVALSWGEYRGKNGPGYRIRVTNLREKGRYVDTIRLKTDSDLKPEIRVKVFGNVEAP